MLATGDNYRYAKYDRFHDVARDFRRPVARTDVRFRRDHDCNDEFSRNHEHHVLAVEHVWNAVHDFSTAPERD